MTDATPYIVPKERGSWRAITLAALVHLALFAFLWIGVRWQSETPATIEAEVWSPQPREAAPLPEPPKPEPEVKPEPKPEVKEPPKPKVEEPPVVKPDIALAQEKKRKEEEKKRREEEERREKEKKKLEEEKLAKLEEAKRKEKEKAEKAKKEAEQKRREDQLLAKMREEDMKRITGGVTGTGGSGDAPKAQGGRASADYLSRIAAKIKSNITFIAPEGLQGNPPVEYEVRLLPDGSVAGLRKIRSSGVPGFDEAVERAIQRAQPFPRDTNGTVPPSFIGTHRPKDQ
ncbi:cell envelope integrity protein TolA [Herbaspirillum sp. HC18]|nr:cell envelope integrity protein TolA [Herbaspirillum sp. HC18]